MASHVRKSLTDLSALLAHDFSVIFDVVDGDVLLNEIFRVACVLAQVAVEKFFFGKLQMDAAMLLQIKSAVEDLSAVKTSAPEFRMMLFSVLVEI